MQKKEVLCVYRANKPCLRSQIQTVYFDDNDEARAIVGNFDDFDVVSL